MKCTPPCHLLLPRLASDTVPMSPWAKQATTSSQKFVQIVMNISRETLSRTLRHLVESASQFAIENDFQVPRLKSKARILGKESRTIELEWNETSSLLTYLPQHHIFIETNSILSMEQPKKRGLGSTYTKLIYIVVVFGYRPFATQITNTGIPQTAPPTPGQPPQPTSAC